MCTIMIIPGIKPELKEAAWRFAKTARPLLTQDNNDAFGYAALGPSGLFAERWTTVSRAFKPDMSQRGDTLLKKILGGIVKPEAPSYATHGIKTEEVSALIMHARMATSGGGIENAHPFIVDDTALIHNGVITNDKDIPKRVSTCDSEAILTKYLEHDVSAFPQQIQAVADALTGWYATAILAPHAEYGYVLDVFKEPMSNLHAGYVAELDTVVFATKPHLITQTAKRCGFATGQITEVPEDLLIRINPYTGELIGHVPFASGMLDELIWRTKPAVYSAEIGREPYGVDDASGKLLPIRSDIGGEPYGGWPEAEERVREAFNGVTSDDAPEAVDEYVERTGYGYAEATKRWYSNKKKWRKGD